MTQKPLINFKSVTETNVHLIPINTLVHIDDYDGSNNSKLIIVKDVSMLTNISTVQDLLDNGVYIDILSSSGVNVYNEKFVAIEGQSLFSPSIGYLPYKTEVFVDGIRLNTDEYTDSDGISITFSELLNNKNVIQLTLFI